MSKRCDNKIFGFPYIKKKNLIIKQLPTEKKRCVAISKKKKYRNCRVKKIYVKSKPSIFYDSFVVHKVNTSDN